MAHGHAGHVGDGVERTGRAVERDAEVAGALRRGRSLSRLLCAQPGGAEHERRGEHDDAEARSRPHGAAGVRKTKYTAPRMQSAAQR